ncbi:MAG: hypothetical protein KGZ51_04945 [Erysipelothrix sp.]|jgi:uncharacterized membrane protein|nr:hypothetical protein [Erysipelothrix sp.]
MENIILILIFIILVFLGGFATFLPTEFIDLLISWKFNFAKPSDEYTFIVSINGGVVLVGSILILFALIR